MNTILIILLIGLVAFIAYLYGSGNLTADAFKSSKNNIPTLQTVTSQTDAPLITSQSTQGLFGFPDPTPTNDPNSAINNILTKDLISEDVVRNLYNNSLAQVQVNAPSGNGQGVQTKTISAADAAQLFNAKTTAAFTKVLSSGAIKLVQDPTSGLIGVSLTQETVNRAKTDPQLASALGLIQQKAPVGSY